MDSEMLKELGNMCGDRTVSSAEIGAHVRRKLAELEQYELAQPRAWYWCAAWGLSDLFWHTVGVR